MTANQIQENTEIETTNEVSHEVTIFAEPIFNIGSFQVTNSLLTSWLTVLIILGLKFKNKEYK